MTSLEGIVRKCLINAYFSYFGSFRTSGKPLCLDFAVNCPIWGHSITKQINVGFDRCHAPKGPKSFTLMKMKNLGEANNDKLRYFPDLVAKALVHDDIQSGPSPGEPVLGWLGWLWFLLFHPLPSSAWAHGKLSEVAESVGKVLEPNPGSPKDS